MDIAGEIFEITDKLPRREDYGFSSQIRRSVLSISANIAEAYGRQHTLDKTNFYYYASPVKYFLVIARFTDGYTGRSY